MARRVERVGELLRGEVSDLLRRRVKDPRLAALVSVTRVKVAPDLSHAQVYVSVLGDDEEKAAVMAALQAATGYLRHELGQRVTLRRLPALSFLYDETMEQAARVTAILDQLPRQQE
jgi:ribosome-binding factor A